MRATLKPSAAAAGSFFASGLSLRLLRGGLRLLTGISPRLGGGLAYRLFTTPLPTKLGARRRAMPAHWRATHWAFEDRSLVAWQQVAAAAVPVASARPRVLLVHGWAGAAGQLVGLADHLWQAGFDPVLLEMPAHGHGHGWRSDLPQFVRAVYAAAARLGPLHGLVAHSMGALAAAHALGQGLRAERLVMLAPSPPPTQVLGWFGSVFGLGTATLAGLAERLAQQAGMPLEGFEPARLGAALQLPTLVVHDTDDRVAPLAHAQALAAALPQGQLLLSSGLGHRRLLGDAQVMQEVSRHLSGGGAGACSDARPC